MSKGPKFNNINKNFTSRDSLGIEGATASIQGELCPVINTVTPRAFYWIFMVWNYYDFYMNYKGKKNSYDDFDKPFLKKNDYFFVLSNLMIPNSDQTNMVGKEKTSQDLANNPNGPYMYNPDYFITRFGGMQYFNAGCLTLGFITDTNQNGTETYNLPRLTEQLGKPMAIAFENVIKDTEYYKNYRLSNKPVPKKVLEEFGKKVSINLDGFDECKALLRNALFEPKNNANLNNSNLIASADYIKMLYEEYDIHNPSLSDMRNILFDYFSSRGDQKDFDKNLSEIIVNWEIVVGRQYLTMAIELIWKYMLEQLLIKPMTIEEWINDSLKYAKWTVDKNLTIENILNDCNFSFEEREGMIAKGYRNRVSTESNIENAIKLLLSLYNRFNNRDDINTDYLQYGNSVSIAALIKLVDEYKQRSIVDFAIYIMTDWIVKQHEETALEKMFYGRDGYFFEKIEDLYIFRKEMTPDFQGIRLIQLMQVMKDLDILGD